MKVEIRHQIRKLNDQQLADQLSQAYKLFLSTWLIGRNKFRLATIDFQLRFDMSSFEGY